MSQTVGALLTVQVYVHNSYKATHSATLIMNHFVVAATDFEWQLVLKKAFVFLYLGPSERAICE